MAYLLHGVFTLYSPWWGNQASRSYFLAAALFRAPRGQLRLMEWSRVALWPRKKYPRQWRPHDMGVLVIGRILRLSVSFHKTKFQRYSESPSEVAIIWSKASQLPSGFVKTNCWTFLDSFAWLFTYSVLTSIFSLMRREISKGFLRSITRESKR